MTGTEQVTRLIDFTVLLSPEQKAAFEQLHFFTGEPPTPPTAVQSPPVDLWFSTQPSRATSTEVQLLAVLLVNYFMHSKDMRALANWLGLVEQDAPRQDGD